MRLFQTSRRFKVEIQPQLTLLQKTLLNVEGLGRQLDPELDLWKTVKPIMQTWMNQQVGFKGFWEKLKSEAPHWAQKMPTIPRLITTYLELEVHAKKQNQLQEIINLLEKQKRFNFHTNIVSIFGIGALLGGAVTYLFLTLSR